MPIFVLDDSLSFPPAAAAEADGLLAIGGDLSPERLLNAYRSGIFPWYEGDPILWWSPDPRFVLIPQELRISKSMRTVLNQSKFRFTTNTAFRLVMENCRNVRRANQDGTWINENMINAYSQLHQQGYAFSAEAWEKDELVGGLYGIWIGKAFFGESMFSLKSNASKFAFIKWVQFLQKKGVQLIDCQVYTEHLESLGARMVSRESFLEFLALNNKAEA
ncbi:leucyl/phenylalanyl-tRNA--protein transferase [Flavihumibacter profundi]|uniref:leucyl/phenylalanyl-tRNA--protein transferase n=1 Tax=Flavihumibacter profundi TaxID=2716883 RepID=UPI001CC4D439|nr:leucyl/phenylalanyl-tRNA--protein transferase [Flavihumibacter profundi]MBZ5856351.1 leucyl/phenylalanyl-tRNA--protein transferase [Flavihumibacter profundi]